MSEIKEKIESFPTKWPEGFTNEEEKKLCEELNIDYSKYCHKLGVNTCIVKEGESLTYHCDVELAVRLCLENRDKTLMEWD